MDGGRRTDASERAGGEEEEATTGAAIKPSRGGGGDCSQRKNGLPPCKGRRDATSVRRGWNFTGAFLTVLLHLENSRSGENGSATCRGDARREAARFEAEQIHERTQCSLARRLATRNKQHGARDSSLSRQQTSLGGDSPIKRLTPKRENEEGDERRRRGRRMNDSKGSRRITKKIRLGTPACVPGRLLDRQTDLCWDLQSVC